MRGSRTTPDPGLPSVVAHQVTVPASAAGEVRPLNRSRIDRVPYPLRAVTDTVNLRLSTISIPAAGTGRAAGRPSASAQSPAMRSVSVQYRWQSKFHHGLLLALGRNLPKGHFNAQVGHGPLQGQRITIAADPATPEKS